MPRKTSASTIQNRNNQRLSRARHREFIEDLQRRLQEYERCGVEASLEMQRAARSVALENQRLRALLATRGVSQDEIDTHLFGPEAICDVSEARSESTPIARDRPRIETGQTGSTVRAAAGPRGGSSSRMIDHLPSPPTSAVPSPYSSLAGRASPDSACAVSTAGDFAIKNTRQEPVQEEPCQALWPGLPGRDRTSHLFYDVPGQDVSSILPPVSDCYCPPLSPASALNQTSTLEISCEAAARILAGIRGHADSARDLSALGCAGTRDCMVSNTRLFQLMDEMG